VLKLRLQTAARFPFSKTQENAAELMARVRGGKLSAELIQVRHQTLVKSSNPTEQVWVLDERGKSWSSNQWAEKIGTLADQGIRQITLVVGAADGFNDAQRKAADELISISPCVLPSWLACLVCAEQIYRSDTILRGTPYHRS
jgi:23S rRNA (pseudouridine1915-N3)-methyltransferase